MAVGDPTVDDPVSPLTTADPRWVAGYRLHGRLGSGGMGTVYLATAPEGGPVAVKLVHAALAVDDHFCRRFAQEVALARRVAPFCTAAVRDHGVDGGRPYLVTEYVEGPPLGQMVARRGALGGAEVHGVALGVATALTAIHAAGLVHRDLKPGNVILSLSGPRVIDFGIARALADPSGLTRTGMTVGSPGWMAPEQVIGEPTTPAADVFAWGCLVAYAGTGRHPYGASAEDPLTRAMQVLYNEPRLYGLADPLRALITQALHRDPRRRPEARDLVLALSEGDAGAAQRMRSDAAQRMRPGAGAAAVTTGPVSSPGGDRPAFPPGGDRPVSSPGGDRPAFPPFPRSSGSTGRHAAPDPPADQAELTPFTSGGAPGDPSNAAEDPAGAAFRALRRAVGGDDPAGVTALAPGGALEGPVGPGARVARVGRDDESVERLGPGGRVARVGRDDEFVERLRSRRRIRVLVLAGALAAGVSGLFGLRAGYVGDVGGDGGNGDPRPVRHGPSGSAVPGAPAARTPTPSLSRATPSATPSGSPPSRTPDRTVPTGLPVPTPDQPPSTGPTPVPSPAPTPTLPLPTPSPAPTVTGGDRGD